MPAASASSPGNPETPTEKLRDFVAGLIDLVATQGNRAIDSFGLRTPGNGWSPNVDVIEFPDHVLVLADLPGIEPEAVEVLLAGNMLTLRGNQPAEKSAPDRTVHRAERPAGSFSRSIPLPVSVDPEKVNAESRNGVLSVRLMKEERQRPRQIPIETHDQ